MTHQNHQAEDGELSLASDSIELDQAGRITFVEPEILETIVAAAKKPIPAETDVTINIYQCGRAAQ
jgi:hypothetical protein